MRILPFTLMAAILVAPVAGGEEEPVITTVAGGGPDEVPALSANIPLGEMAMDGSDNLYFVNLYDGWVDRVDPGGELTKIAGPSASGETCVPGRIIALSGSEALPAGGLGNPVMATVDAPGNLFVTDRCRLTVRRRDAVTGAVAILAGNGTRGYRDWVPGTSASFESLRDVVVDRQGNLFINDIGNSRVRKWWADTGIVGTVAGNGIPGAYGDGGPGTGAAVVPNAIALDPAGNLLIAAGFARVRRGEAETGIITTVAGTGSPGFSGDGGPATQAQIRDPYGVASDSAGNLFLSDSLNHRVRRVDAGTGIITTVAGNGSGTFGGDGGLATAAGVPFPTALLVTPRGDLLIESASRIRRVDAATGIITTMGGNGEVSFSGEGIPALQAALAEPGGMAVDRTGDLLVADTMNRRVRRVDRSTGIITTVAGNGTPGFSGDGIPAAESGLVPSDLTVDRAGNVFIADYPNYRILRVDAVTGLITTVAGNGRYDCPADLVGPATAVCLRGPLSVAVDPPGDLFIADSERVRRVDAATGIIATVAGSDNDDAAVDGIPATQAFVSPIRIILDPGGNLLISDGNLNRVRRIDARTGIITTVAGNGLGAFSGDGGPATAAGLTPDGLALDSRGNLFVADYWNDRTRRVDAASGTITTVAGGGSSLGEGIPPLEASLVWPGAVAVDASGALFIAVGDLVRRVGPPARPPAANAGPDLRAECSSSSGARVLLDGSGSSDPDSAPGTGDGIAAYQWLEDSGTPGEALLGTGETLPVTLSLGVHDITLRVTDTTGLQSTDDLTVSVEDTVPPEISAGAAPSILWPPDHRLVVVHASVDARDVCGTPRVILESIASSEPDDALGAGDGGTLGDIRDAGFGSADFDFSLRAERAGSGTGRIYTVKYLAWDAAGNVAEGMAAVSVPLNNSKGGTGAPKR